MLSYFRIGNFLLVRLSGVWRLASGSTGTYYLSLPELPCCTTGGSLYRARHEYRVPVRRCVDCISRLCCMLEVPPDPRIQSCCNTQYHNSKNFHIRYLPNSGILVPNRYQQQSAHTKQLAIYLKNENAQIQNVMSAYEITQLK